MGVEVLVTVVAALASAIAGLVANLLAANAQFAESWIGRLLLKVGFKPKKTEAFAEKLTRLTSELSRASAEVDATLAEIGAVAEQRQKAVQQLETEMNNLSAKERELKERVAALESVSLPAVEHFVKLTAPGERRSAWRDYILFLAGVVVSTITAIVLRLVGLG
jgi:methyl-accepting chemotaxis protein